MIQRINRLRSFGIYRDFCGDAQTGVPVFKKRNLLYGWNYSGKTTISRLFQSLQWHDRPLAYPTGRFTVELGDGTQITEGNRLTKIPVRVFNREYISTNFQAEHTAPAVFIVGEENLALRQRLAALQAAQQQLSEREQRYQSQIDQINAAIASAGTNRARTVGEILGVRNFRRDHLDTRLREVRNAPEAYLLTDDRRQAAIEVHRAGDQFAAITPIQNASSAFADEIAVVRPLLGRTASFDAIAGLRDNPNLERWLDTGTRLHEQATTCSFCGGELRQHRLDELRRHFSTAYQELLAAVDQSIARLNAIRFDPPRLNTMEFLQEFREQSRQGLERFSNWLEHCRNLRESLIAVLDTKRTALERTLTWEGDDTRVSEGPGIVADLNALIQRHNESVRNMGAVKQDARVAVERHFAALHFQEEQITPRENQVANFRKKIRNAIAGRQRLERMTGQIAAQIDRAARGAGRFKELVNFLLRGSEIHVESRNELQFLLMRGTVPAEKLSDGEKTAIAFAYFVTSLEADGEDIANTVVYIDDPISSLDSNHVYAVFALIQERLEISHQLFVSTHNSEFFNLLKTRWLNNRDLRHESEAFYVRRLADANGSYAQLESLPVQLRKFGSEYQFLFAQLHAFATNTTPSEFEAYAAPNLLRRFLEAYLGFRKPHVSAWHEKLDLIFNEPEAAREVHRICDDASHLQRLGRALEEPAFVSSSQACVRSVLDGLRQKDPTHYNSMTAAVQ